MVKNLQSRSAKMPMLELIFVIGFFAIISVFILQLFLSANMLQSKAKDEGKAIVQCERIAEMIKAADNFEDAKNQCGLLEYTKIDRTSKIEKTIINRLTSKTEKTIYAMTYDKDWNECQQEAMYTMVIVPSVNTEFGQNMEEYDVYVYRLQDYASLFHQQDKEELEVYHLHFTKYRK